MTRVNLVPVSELSDQHLLAEWRELPRLASYAERAVNPVIPPSYCLGAGHMKFFLDKAGFLERRHVCLTTELLRRRFKLKQREPFKMIRRFPQVVWTPTPAEVETSRRRIKEKLNLKPGYYTWSKRK